ncbi:MAG TPA: GtrA family protein [Chromatiales bacterium]|nr:GtrA family protein [Chromatiales bacterium]
MRRFARFCVGGALGFVTDAAVLWVLTRLGWSPYLARLPAFGLAVLVTWRWHLARTFADRDHRGGGAGGFARYLATQAGGLGTNLGVYWMLLGLLPSRQGAPMVALTLASAAALALNWTGASRWAFRARDPDRVG